MTIDAMVWVASVLTLVRRLRSPGVVRGRVRPASRQTVWVRGGSTKPYFGVPASTPPESSAAVRDPACLARDPSELREVAPRSDVGRFARIDRPDRDRIDRQPQRDAARDHLDLELEAR